MSEHPTIEAGDWKQARRGQWRRPTLVVSLYLAAWYGLDLVSSHFETAPEIRVWFPPSALDVALLLVFGLRYWPALFLNTLLHNLFVAHRHLPWGTLLVSDIVTTAGYWAACALLLRRVRIHPGLPAFRDVAWFMFLAAGAAPFAIAAAQAVNFAGAGIVPWAKIGVNALLYGAGDATGVAMLCPLLLLLCRHVPGLWTYSEGRPPMRGDAPLWPSRREAPQALAELIVLVAATWAAYHIPANPALNYQYVVSVPLLWIAARHGFERAVVAVFLFNIVAAFLAWDRVKGTNALTLQFGLMAATQTGVLLGAFITERIQQANALHRGEQRFQAVARATNDALWDWDLATGEVWRSDSFFGLSGDDLAEVSPHMEWWQVHIHPEDHERVLTGLYAAIDDGKREWAAEYRYRRGDGAYASLADRGSILRDEAGRATRMIGGMTDITERQQAQEALRHHAFHDVLTGLPNRALFMDRLGHALAQSRRRADYLCAVLFLDLDRFKVINDSLGHTFGDQFLVTTTQRLLSCLRPMDTAARLGGDEFTVLLENMRDEGDALRVAERVQAQTSLPVRLDGQEVSATVSIGIVLIQSAQYHRAEDVLRDADIAMYRAKTGGKARYEVFDADMHTRAVALLRLETDLRRALEEQEFRLHYQPIVVLETGEIAGFEALVRWQHPQRGLLPPGDFLPLAEETGLILPLGQWVLNEACGQMRAWRRQFPERRGLTVSVNLASRQFAQAGLVETITQTLRETSLEAASLRLEITESGIMENGELALTILRRLRALGLSVAIDDFGTGHSSLSRLRDLPLDALKVDRSFTRQMTDTISDSGGQSAAMMNAIVLLAHSLGLEVVAEGIETPQQLAGLRALNCRYGQGYLFSPALDPEAAAMLLQTRPHW